jgi:AcrR family transcriptional regulator
MPESVYLPVRGAREAHDDPPTELNVTATTRAAGGHSARDGRAGSAVNTLQRDRIIAATIQVLEEVGYARMTVSQVIGRARMSRTTFYEVFSDREECFTATFEQLVAEVLPRIERAYASQADWHGGMRSALATLLELMDRFPGIAKLFVVESLEGGERILRRRAEALDELALVIDRGRSPARGGGPPPLAARVLAGGVLEVLHMHMLRNDPQSFTTLLGPLMYMIVLAYLGSDAAAGELQLAPARESPKRRRGRSRPAHVTTDGLTIRLTHRTMLVLAVIAANPGASNREVAQQSGVVDQGQISKLLSRLARRGLIENADAGHALGSANQWHLTDLGAQVERSTVGRGVHECAYEPRT